MSGEHLFPRWAHSFLHRYPSNKKAQHVEKHYGEMVVAPFKEKVRPGQASTLTFKVVCKKCNETWMEGIERAARPYLTALAKGEPLTLRPPDMEKLANWLTLKAIISAGEHSGDIVLRGADRTEFMNSRKIANGVKIWIGFHQVPNWYTRYYWSASAIGVGTMLLPPVGTPKNIQTAFLGVGHVFGVVLINRIPGIELGYKGAALHEIYPPQARNIPWPPSVELREGDITRLALSLQNWRESRSSPLHVISLA